MKFQLAFHRLSIILIEVVVMMFLIVGNDQQPVGPTFAICGGLRIEGPNYCLECLLRPDYP